MQLNTLNVREAGESKHLHIKKTNLEKAILFRFQLVWKLRQLRPIRAESGAETRTHGSYSDSQDTPTRKEVRKNTHDK